MAVAHFTLDFGFGYKRRYGVNNDHVDSAAADQRLGDFQCILSGVGLRYEKGVHINAECRRIGGVERVLNVDKRHGAAVFLSLRDAVQ